MWIHINIGLHYYYNVLMPDYTKPWTKVELEHARLFVPTSLVHIVPTPHSSA